MASTDSTPRQTSAAVITTAAFVNAAPSLSLISQTNPLQSGALPSVGNNMATTSFAAFSSTDLLQALSDRTVPRSTSTSGDLLPDLGLLHLTTSSSSTTAAGNQEALLSLGSSTSQPLVPPPTTNYTSLSADTLTDIDYQSMYT